MSSRKPFGSTRKTSSVSGVKYSKIAAVFDRPHELLLNTGLPLSCGRERCPDPDPLLLGIWTGGWPDVTSVVLDTGLAYRTFVVQRASYFGGRGPPRIVSKAPAGCLISIGYGVITGISEDPWRGRLFRKCSKHAITAIGPCVLGDGSARGYD